MKHFAKLFLLLLPLLLLAGCELIKEDPVPPRPTEQVTVPTPAAQAMPVEDFYDWMNEKTDMSRYAHGPKSSDSVNFVLHQPGQYSLDFTFTAEAQAFTLPMTFDTLTAAGWNIEVGKAQAEMGPNKAMEATWRSDSGKRLLVRSGNVGTVNATYESCPLYRVTVIFRDMDDNYASQLSSAPEFSACGIGNDSTLDDVLGLLGAPTELTYGLAKGGQLSWLELSYQNNALDYIDLRFSGDGQLLTQLTLSRNIR